MLLYFKNLLENEEPTLMPKVTLLFLYLSKKYDAFSSANFFYGNHKITAHLCFLNVPVISVSTTFVLFVIIFANPFIV